MKQLHRLPPSPARQTSTKPQHYLTTKTTSAQRLRALVLSIVNPPAEVNKFKAYETGEERRVLGEAAVQAVETDT